jgi:pentose-5-phosphate-3-epimerase
VTAQLDARGLLRPWHRAHADFTIGGSVYAVPPEERPAVARALAGARCRVHVDVILDADGGHRGVTPRELAALRVAAPGARLDLHLMAPDEPPAGVVDELLAAAGRLGVEAVTTSAPRIAAHRRALDRLREDGVALWLELAPGPVGPQLPDGIDGVLVMFIPPGTREAADPARLAEVARLSVHVPTAVDGGITEQLAAECVASGARYVVAGRSLLTAAAEAAPPAGAASRDRQWRGTHG